MSRQFFIVGCARSGTTLLRRMLDAHSDVAVTGETHFGPRYVRQSPRAKVQNDASTRAAVLNDFIASNYFRVLKIEEEAFRARAMSHFDDPWFPLRVAMEDFGRARKVSNVGEKTPAHALYVAGLARSFPDSRFMFIRRDPRAVVASWDRVEWSRRSAVEVAEVWRRYARAMRRAARRLPGRHLVVRYEELVSDPETVLESACAFLDVEFEPSMLAYYERRPDDSASWELKYRQMTFKPPVASRIDAWRDELRPGERPLIEAICGREMTLAGYTPDASPVARTLSGARLIPPLLPRRLKRSFKLDVG